MFRGFPSGSEASLMAQSVNNPPALQFDPWDGKIPGVGNDYSLQYSCLENSMDRGAWQTTVHRMAKESDITEATNT